MKRAVIFPALFLTLAAVPAPLVVGSVRDQEGAPIAGAVVTAAGARTTTAADGTFALAATRIRGVRITCAYCKPADVAVQSSEPVVAIVQRYRALSESSPSARDLRALPYSRAESAISLRPFVVLTDSRAFLPGARIADRAATPQGGAIIDDGIPDYDIAANVSMLTTIPLFDLRAGDAFAPGQTSYSGDQAAGGVFFLNDVPEQGSDASLIGGSDTAIRRGAFTTNASYALAASGNPLGSSARASAQLHAPAGTDSIDLSFLGARARIAQGSPSTASIEGFRAQFQRVRNTAIQATFVADRAGYTTAFASAPLTSLWSDIVGELTVTSQTPVAIFGNFGVRQSTGAYNADAFRSHIAGAVSQTHLDVGAQTRGDRYTARAAVGAYAIAYNGGAGGTRASQQAQTLVPSLYGSYDLSPQWNLEVYAGASFRLPTLLEAFRTTPEPGGLHIDRYAQITQTLTYSDLSRLKISVTSMSEQLSNLDSGTVHAVGASIAWQLAPTIAVRAWTLTFNDTTVPYEALLRFGRPPQAGTPGSLWLTYENPAGFRLDAIYRSDFLDALPQRHVDASVSAPMAAGLRWFVGTERRQDARSIDAGIRFDQP